MAKDTNDICFTFDHLGYQMYNSHVIHLGKQNLPIGAYAILYTSQSFMTSYQEEISQYK